MQKDICALFFLSAVRRLLPAEAVLSLMLCLTDVLGGEKEKKKYGRPKDLDLV